MFKNVAILPNLNYHCNPISSIVYPGIFILSAYDGCLTVKASSLKVEVLGLLDLLSLLKFA